MTTAKLPHRFAFARLLLLGLFAWSVQPFAAEKTPAGPKANVVGIADAARPGSALGSGVMLTGGRVLTGCHILEDVERLEIRQSGLRSEASLAYADRKRDLCELKIGHPERFRPAALEMRAPGEIDAGETVYAVGAWNGVPKVDKGRVVKVQKQGGDDVVLISSRLTAGYTGGGLFDDSGALVGIVTHRERSTRQLSFAYPAQYVLVRKGSDAQRQSTPAPQEQKTEASPAAQPNPSQAAAQEYLNVLAEAARAGLKYPEEARAQGWSGTTSIHFDLDPGGELRQSYVDVSSGYAGLDAATLIAVRKALEAIAVPEAVKERGLKGTVSITFAKPQQRGEEERADEQ
jgi:TonB family protein